MKDDIAVGLFTEQRCRAHQGRSLLIAKTFIARARRLLGTWEDVVSRPTIYMWVSLLIIFPIQISKKYRAAMH